MKQLLSNCLELESFTNHLRNYERYCNQLHRRDNRQRKKILNWPSSSFAEGTSLAEGSLFAEGSLSLSQLAAHLGDNLSIVISAIYCRAGDKGVSTCRSDLANIVYGYAAIDFQADIVAAAVDQLACLG